MLKTAVCLFSLMVVVAAVPARAEPVDRSGVSVSYGWSGIPTFAKSAVKSTDTTLNLDGYSLAIGYVSYGRSGPEGIFSTRYTFTYDHYRSLPNQKSFTARKADLFILDVAEILTMFPSLPVNLYTGIGTGWGIARVYDWGPAPPGTDPKDVSNMQKSVGKYPMPFPVIYIPVGLNIRIKSFIISAEAGIRDIPYLIGMLTYTFGKEDYVKIVQLPPPPPDTGEVTGTVFDRDTKGPLGRAVVQMVNTSMTDLSTNPVSGAFTTPGLKAGTVTLLATKDGYVSNSVTVTVQAGKTVSTTIALHKESLVGAVYGTVSDAHGVPLSASVSAVPVSGTTAGQAVSRTTANGVTGGFFIMLLQGSYTVSASLPGYKTQTKQVTVTKGFKTGVRFVMEPEQAAAPAPPPPAPVAPIVKKSPRVIIEKAKKKIVITEKIYFKLGRATISPVSFSILDELADVLNQNPGIRIRIEGYTDNTGRPSLNRRLSQARAESVMHYLSRRGVLQDRMTAKGYGMSNPIASNRTAAGRAENRRVEFTITSH